MFDDIIGKPARRSVMDGLKEKYLGNPDFCPYCGDTRFEVSDWSNRMDAGEQAEVQVKCMACGKGWVDTIMLNDLEDVDIIDVEFI